MMRFPLVFILPSLLTTYVCLATTSSLEKKDFSTTIFTPPSSYEGIRVCYARSLMLTVNDNQGTILSTWENLSGGKQWYPIYRSIDHGYTWSSLSKVEDQVNGWGMKDEPMLYELKEDFAGYSAGSILLAGNSIPSDLSKTQLDLYVSTDKGNSWKFVSHIASGGEAQAVNGNSPVWEPFLIFNNGKLHCFYSDQRDSKYGQKIVHQSTSDLKNWGPVIDDIKDDFDYDARPGMPTIAKIGNGKFMMTFEYCGKNNCNVYYKINSDPSTSWNSILPTQLITKEGIKPFSSPYLVWTPAVASDNGKGKASNGTIVVNSYSSADLYLNEQNGDPNAWKRLSTSSPPQYSRSLAVGHNPKDILIIGGGGVMNGDHNTVTLYVRDITGCSTC